MTDIEAYELLLKYCGGEKGLVMIKEMIHIGGIDVAVKNMVKSYEGVGKKVPADFEVWMRQSFSYIQSEMSKPLN